MRWNDAGATFHGTKLSAVVENRVDHQIDVELFAIVASRSGERRELRIHQAPVKSRGAVNATVNMASLPVQTVGASSAVNLEARWTRTGPMSTDPNEIPVPTVMRSMSETRYVTWDPGRGFQEATVRTEKEQILEDDQLRRRGRGPALVEMRVADAKGVVRALDATEIAKKPMAGAGVVRDDDPENVPQASNVAGTSSPEAEGR